ncbi:hypothetical protein B0H12DRAFT_1131832 [Mycena haematopus]|nr:hypothetical protein B0H12DRAFT_1131832 [Mycena haematopus]
MLVVAQPLLAHSSRKPSLPRCSFPGLAAFIPAALLRSYAAPAVFAPAPAAFATAALLCFYCLHCVCTTPAVLAPTAPLLLRPSPAVFILTTRAALRRCIAITAAFTPSAAAFVCRPLPLSHPPPRCSRIRPRRCVALAPFSCFDSTYPTGPPLRESTLDASDGGPRSPSPDASIIH